ncbi:hypothetical protein MOQ_006663 [Trypanosoma cruzi marinkellei]|uniref:Uncharacterized protein n=1 Tax=Trypanosoma cruzi marinkellei TaxID=85056 RepID=K2N4G6_TRYCR|nr:hypothetical protein MOQ_006663 [Trypanosoma cruzi marinkellei]
MAGACWCGKGSIPGVDLAVVASSRGTVRWCDATPAHSSTGPHAPRGLQATPVLFLPSLPFRDDRPATASAGNFLRRHRRKPLSTSGRWIHVLLPNLRRSALVRPQYDGTCPTCSAWRSDTWRGPRMRTPKRLHRLFNRRLSRTSAPKSQACQQARHAGSTNACVKGEPGAFATASQTSRAADSSTDHGRLRFIRCWNAPSFGIVTATVWDRPSPHDGLFATEYLPVFVRTALRHLLVILTAYKEK